MGAKYSHGVWEQFADQAGTILGDQIFNGFLDVSRNNVIFGRGHFLHLFAKLMVPN